MAEKKNVSRAEKAVSDAKRKSNVTSSTGGKSSEEKNSRKTTVVKIEPKQSSLPGRVVVSIISLSLFLLFVFTCINPDGALLKVIQSFVMGFVGHAGFYFSIPALLYLFCINAFSRKAPVVFRNVCVITSSFICGCIYHLIVQNQGIAQGIAVLKDLYLGGIEGSTGGILCGGFAMLLRWAFGNVVSYVICALTAVIALLGCFQITIPGLIRAIAERPRYMDEDEPEEKPYIEPAKIVVDHIANKQIEHKRKKRRQQQEQLPPPETVANVQQNPISAKTNKQSAPIPEEVRKAQASSDSPSRGAAVLSTMELDIDTPISGATMVCRSSDDPLVQTDSSSDESIPSSMPELNVDPPVFVSQKNASTAQDVQSPKSPEPESPKRKVTAKEAAASAELVAEEIAQGQAAERAEYCFPPIMLLKKPSRISADGTDEMRENTRRLNETLASFKIDAHIINVTRGPSVTRYEVELDKGVRLNKLTGCADDIALSLGASGVRIAAVPGKISIVGIEVPNQTVTTVSLREVIDSSEFKSAKSKSSFAVGKDISGACIVGNIAKMPHMLIAGTTGSGKSVCMNSIIISLLYKASPDDVKLIMVDPKMVELGIYNGIPHLLIPVVTDPKKAAGSLQWAVVEMMRRYKLMSDLGVRDLESYNSIVTAEEDGQKLPQVVVIIDELADLMMVAAKEVEDSICRIAQMGRAAGMHLIIATQRPSADVITGLMKANIPSRIAFSVASAMESRIILDTMGAEKLVGKGDMLYSPIGSGKPLRVQGCFVSDSEVEAVASYVKENYVAEYNQEVLEEIEQKARQAGKKSAASDPEPSADELDGDDMLPAAVDVILETGQASVSMLQRRLKLGYARAARIVDEMEEKGIVGPFQGSKPRSILITKEQWAERKGSQPKQLGFEDMDLPKEVPEDIC